MKQPAHLHSRRQHTSLRTYSSSFSQEGKQMQDTGDSSANNDSSPIMKAYSYHCSHPGTHKHIHRKIKSTVSFTVKKNKDPTWNYQPQPGETQQKVLHSLEFKEVSDREKKFLVLWKATGCSEHTGDDDQTQIAQSTLLSNRRTQLEQKSCAQYDFTASNSQTRQIKASLVKPARTTAFLQIPLCAKLQGGRRNVRTEG